LVSVNGIVWKGRYEGGKGSPKTKTKKQPGTTDIKRHIKKRGVGKRVILGGKDYKKEGGARRRSGRTAPQGKRGTTREIEPGFSSSRGFKKADKTVRG